MNDLNKIRYKIKIIHYKEIKEIFKKSFDGFTNGGVYIEKGIKYNFNISSIF